MPNTPAHARPARTLLAAFDKLGLPSREVLMVGDAPFDIEAGQRAGVDTVMLSRFDGAVAVYDNPQGLLKHLDEVLGEHEMFGKRTA